MYSPWWVDSAIEEVLSLRNTSKEMEPMEPEVVVNDRGGKQSYVGVAFHLIPQDALRMVAEVLFNGATKYGEWNWTKIPTSDHINHALAHINLFLLGDRSEPHLTNAACRILFALHMENQSNDDN